MRVAQDLPTRPWRLDTSIVFHAVHRFRDRLKNIRALIQIMLDFSRLERAEIGGNKVRGVTRPLAVLY